MSFPHFLILLPLGWRTPRQLAISHDNLIAQLRNVMGRERMAVWCAGFSNNNAMLETFYMATKDFIRQRICIYAGREFDPAIDAQVKEVLRAKFNILLPQRTSLNESLASVTSDHEIISLILQYRKS